MKNYKSMSFIRKIEMNLANVSVKPGDKFQLVRAYYDIDSFDCELCGHKDCMYAFEVKNIESQTIIKVGSECIHHWADKGVDIDLAEGLMQRVTSASNKARRDLKKRLGDEAWKALPEEERKAVKYWEQKDFIEKLGNAEYKKMSADEKRELVVSEFLTLQTKQLLADVSRAKTILDENDVKLILELGMEEQMEKALNQQKTIVLAGKIRDGLKRRDFNAIEVKSMIDEFEILNPNNYYFHQNSFDQRVKLENYKTIHREKYGWLVDYTGSNWSVLSTRRTLYQMGNITENEAFAAHSLIDAEKAKTM